ncbi:MAG: hypothetical protein ACRDK2_12700 [Solirubrobacteraceae bacterium]
MSELPDPQNGSADSEEIDGLVVAERVSASRRFGAGARLVPISTGAQVVQAAAVAATGFLAGAAVVGLVAHRHQRSPRSKHGRRHRSRSSRTELMQIVASRSLLVDLHLLGGPGDR